MRKPLHEMRLSDEEFNRLLAAMIITYWQDRGLAVQARVVPTVTRDGRGEGHRIVSDMQNGSPIGKTWRAGRG